MSPGCDALEVIVPDMMGNKYIGFFKYLVRCGAPTAITIVLIAW